MQHDLKNHKEAWRLYRKAMYIHGHEGRKVNLLTGADLGKAADLEFDLRECLGMEAKNPTPMPPNFPVLHTQYEHRDIQTRPDPIQHKDLMTFDNEEDSVTKGKYNNQDFQQGV